MIKNLICSLLLILFIVANYNCSPNKDRNIPDVSHLNVEVNLHRLEKELFTIDTTQIAEGLAQFQQNYPQIVDFYFYNLLNFQPPTDSTASLNEQLRGLLTWKPLRQLYDTCQIVFDDMTKFEREMEQAFKFYKYYFPEKSIPKLYTVITEYSAAIIIPPVDSSILIGLDLFMGPSYQQYYHSPIQLPKYLVRTLTKEQLPVRVFEGIVEDITPGPPGEQLIDFMINNGKKLYIMDALFPFAPDSVKLGYTEAQTKWCYENEFNIWQYFITEDLLYETDWFKIRKYVTGSPTSPGMPPEAPGKTANFIGFMIIKSYMERFPNTSLQRLMEEENSQKILDAARYRPS